MVTPPVPLPEHATSSPPPPWQAADFDYELPDELIAQHPLPQRSASRLLDGRGATAIDRVFSDLPRLLRPGDLLVFNDTAVVKARLFGHKASGGRVELLVERVLPPMAGRTAHEAVVHLRANHKPRVGTLVTLDGGDPVELLGRWPDAQGALFHVRFARDPFAVMSAHGHVPLPPYIHHRADARDEQRYQTVFARHPGAVAAPTAALHFDDALLAALEAQGVRRAAVTLHVGAGTFAPVKTEDIRAHTMHAEWYDIPFATQEAIHHTRQAGGRIVAVGTTSVRSLESWAQTGATQGDTRIFITPGFPFKWVDQLLTNFHLPRSTLMMLVSAFSGHAHVMALYQHAVRQRYRFFSYGDAMLLQRSTG